MLLILFLINCILVLLVHVIFSRINIYLDLIGSGQKLLLAVFPVVIFIDLCVSYLFWNGKFSLSDNIYFFILVILSFYIYFHVFNMSDTARRIKLLIDIAQGFPDASKGHPYCTLNPIQIRIERLKLTSQIYEKDGCLFIKNRVILTLSKIVALFRSLLGFSRNE